MPHVPESASDISTVARLAASARMKEFGASAGLETALRYRLVSPWTHWLVIAERAEDEKAQDMPALRQVPQTLAAGWGGTGEVVACMSLDIDPESLPRFSRSRPGVPRQVCSAEYLDLPAHLRDMACDSEPGIPKPFRLLLALVEEDPGRLELLQDQARHEESLIEEMGQHGIDLLHLAHEGAIRNIFSHKNRESLERFAGFRGLLR